LTKEIELTQQLIELFVKYQIPADLLSFDAEIDAPEPKPYVLRCTLNYYLIFIRFFFVVSELGLLIEDEDLAEFVIVPQVSEKIVIDRS
jgi:hypothetical protein